MPSTVVQKIKKVRPTPTRYATLNIAMPVTLGAGNTCKFERCIVFHFQVNGEHGTDRRRDGRDLTCNAVS